MSQDLSLQSRKSKLQELLFNPGASQQPQNTQQLASSPGQRDQSEDAARTHRPKGFLSLINFQTAQRPSQNLKARSEAPYLNTPEAPEQKPNRGFNFNLTSQNLRRELGSFQFDNFSMRSAWNQSEIRDSSPKSPQKGISIPEHKNSDQEPSGPNRFKTINRQTNNEKPSALSQAPNLEALKAKYGALVLPAELATAFESRLQAKGLLAQKSNPLLVTLLKALYSELTLCQTRRSFSEFLQFKAKDEAIVEPEKAPPAILQLFSLLEALPSEFVLLFGLACSSLFKLPSVRTQILPFGPITYFDQLNSDRVHKLVRLRCLIIKVSTVRLLVSQMEFKCADCQQTTLHCFRDFVFEYPRKCAHSECQGRSFLPLKRTSRAILSQRLKVQELEHEIGNPGIAQLELREEFVNELNCGDQIDAVGVLRPEALAREEALGKQQFLSSGGGLFSTFVEIVGLKILNQRPEQKKKPDHIADCLLQQANEKSSRSGALSANQMSEACKMHADFFSKCLLGEFGFELMIKHFCPSVTANELVKAFCLLSLCAPSTVHLLLMGPSSSGKTSLLGFAEQSSPQGVKGKELELFPRLTKEVGSELTIEPGKIALCNNGVCCIDDLHALPWAVQGRLIDVMDNRQMPIGKAGCFGTLSGQASILAGAEIKDKAYDPRLCLKDNVKILPALVQKFDFALLLKANSSFLLNNISQKLFNKKRFRPISTIEEEEESGPQDFQAIRNEGFSTYIRQRIKLLSANLKDAVLAQSSVYKGFVGYVKSLPVPSISSEVASYLRDFYIELRDQYKNSSLEISLRLYFSMLKLAQSRARFDKRNSVSLQHANEVIEMIKELFGRLCETSNRVLIEKPSKGSKENKDLSNPKKQRLFVSTLSEVAKEVGNWTFEMRELRELSDNLGLAVEDFQLFVDKLNLEGVLLKKGNGLYELTKL